MTAPTRSPVFGELLAVKEHLVRGRGVNGEVRDLRLDTEKAFFDFRLPVFAPGEAPTPSAGRLVVDGTSGAILSGDGEVWLSPTAGNVVVWAPFATATPGGAYVEWADAVRALGAVNAPFTVLQIEADPWHDEVVIPAGTWQLNNTIIVGKVAYAQGGRNWVASPDYGQQGLNAGWLYYNQQFRGHQIKLWVHPESDDGNPCIIKGCIGLKDMFFRGASISNSIEGYTGTFTAYEENPYNTGTGTAILSRGSNGAPFSEADLWTNLNCDTDTEGWWYVTIIEIIDENTVKVDTQGNGSFLVGDAYNGEMYYTTDNNDRMNATFNLWGRLGGRESYFSDYNAALGTSTLVRGYDNSGPSSSDSQFHLSMVGKKIRISNTNTNGGEFNGEYTILYVYDNNTVEIDLDHDMTVDDGDGARSVHWANLDATDEFTLDNVDFRSDYGEFGSLNLWRGNMFLHLRGGASVRNSSVSTDGFLVAQTDGSPVWFGGYSIYSYQGDGYLKIYALADSNLNTTWLEGNADIEFDIYQSNVPYIPNNYGDWSGTRPYSVKEALDRLAAACVAAGYTP